MALYAIRRLESLTAYPRHAKCINGLGGRTAGSSEICGKCSKCCAETVTSNIQRLTRLLTHRDGTIDFGSRCIESRLKADMGVGVLSQSNVEIG